MDCFPWPEQKTPSLCLSPKGRENDAAAVADSLSPRGEGWGEGGTLRSNKPDAV